MIWALLLHNICYDYKGLIFIRTAGEAWQAARRAPGGLGGRNRAVRCPAQAGTFREWEDRNLVYFRTATASFRRQQGLFREPGAVARAGEANARSSAVAGLPGPAGRHRSLSGPWPRNAQAQTTTSHPVRRGDADLRRWLGENTVAAGATQTNTYKSSHADNQGDAMAVKTSAFRIRPAPATRLEAETVPVTVTSRLCDRHKLFLFHRSRNYRRFMQEYDRTRG